MNGKQIRRTLSMFILKIESESERERESERVRE